MKKFIAAAALFMLCGGVAMAQELDQPFSKGDLNPFNKYFTGTTHLTRLSANDDVWHS